MKQTNIIVIAIMMSIVAGCSGTDEIEITPAELVQFPVKVDIKKIWSNSSIGSEEDSDLALMPVYVDEKIFIADARGKLQALDAKTGRRLWQVNTEEKITGALGHGNNRLFIGTRNGRVLALSQSDGSNIWQATLPSEILTAPVVGDGVVVVRTSDGKLFGLGDDDGRRLWVYESSVPPLTLRGISKPIVDRGQVFAGFSNGKLTAVTLKEGKWQWDVAIAVGDGRSELQRIVDVDANPIIKDNVVYAVGYHGRIVALSAATGRIIWSREMSSNTGVAIGDELVFVSNDDSYIWALDRRTGAEMWKQEKLFSRSITGPVVYHDYVIVGDFEGYLHWMSRDSGDFVARYRVGNDPIAVQPLIVNDTIYIKDQSGKVVAIQEDRG